MGSRERDRELLIVAGDEGATAVDAVFSGTAIPHSSGSPASFHHHPPHRKSGGEVSYFSCYFGEFGIWLF